MIREYEYDIEIIKINVRNKNVNVTSALGQGQASGQTNPPLSPLSSIINRIRILRMDHQGPPLHQPKTTATSVTTWRHRGGRRLEGSLHSNKHCNLLLKFPLPREIWVLNSSSQICKQLLFIIFKSFILCYRVAAVCFTIIYTFSKC